MDYEKLTTELRKLERLEVVLSTVGEEMLSQSLAISELEDVDTLQGDVALLMAHADETFALVRRLIGDRVRVLNPNH